ncbi:MAG: hypothetical protein ACI9QD_000306 [Thermoproteota archaeon]|jgi:hypothetical protein
MIDKPINMQALQKRYQKRFTFTRMAKEASKEGEYVTAIRYFNEYLKTMADINDVDPFEIPPTIFDQERDISEMLLVSQIYWELTKIYDMTPKLHSEFTKSLNQFIRFTVNQQYQVVNAEILRKHLRSPNINNAEEFRAAYDQIFIESSKCYISTFCFGIDHNITNTLREFKKELIEFKIGLSFVKIYYYLSPILIKFLSKRNLLKSIFVTISKPFLFSTAITFELFRKE